MNNTTSTKEKVVVGGALAGGLLFFGLLTNTCQNPIDHFKNTKEAAPAISQIVEEGDLTARIAELEGRIEALKDNSADEKTIGDLEAQLANQRSQAAERMESYGDKTASLEARIKNLSARPEAAQLTSSGVGLDTEALSSRIQGLSTALTVEQSKNEELTTKLSAMSSSVPDVDAGELAKLAGKVKFLDEDNKKLAGELTLCRSKIKELKASMNDGGDMSAEVDKLEEIVKSNKQQIAKKNGQIADLSAHINQLKAAKNVFAESADDLPKSAQGLLADLNTLEGKSEADVQAAYVGYVNKHGATARKRIKFSSGSSSVSEADRKEIALLTQGADRNAFFLIVGYADQQGSAASNKKLSSARSISVAKELGVNAKGFQSTQAVYLGQTNRFGASSENRVVEIWEIK